LNELISNNGLSRRPFPYCPFFQMTVALLLISCGCQNDSTRFGHKSRNDTKTLPQWDWASALPGNNIARADLIPVVLDSVALASIVPIDDLPTIQLADGAAEPQPFAITHVAGKTVRNYAQLHAMVQHLADSSMRVPVTVERGGAGASLKQNATPSSAIVTAGNTALESRPGTQQLTPAELRSLEHRIATRHKAIRVIEDSNPWIIIGDGDVRCTLTARLERTTGLLQVVIAFELFGDRPVLLPAEVTARCQGVPLKCLKVAEALELLYGAVSDARASADDRATPENSSFSAVSQSDDYLVPTNYKRLQEETNRLAGYPALAAVAGVNYPGSPLLGDARALARFALQPQMCQPGDPEKIGWIVFSGQALKRGGPIELEIDLGQGPIQLRLTVPKP
jgi:hypothetical protein